MKMKRFTIALLTLVLAFGVPMLATAADHSAHGMASADKMKHGDMDHAKEMSHDMHKGHNMSGMDDSGFSEIGKDTQSGVVATVKVKAYDAATVSKMKTMGMEATHHVMVFFADEKTGAEITAGKAAIKVKGQEAQPVMLMQMGTGFGSDVVLPAGMSTFEIGTKLEDGNKRQFEVMFHNM